MASSDACTEATPTAPLPSLPSLLYLVGLPGTGKNYVGELLRDRFGYEFHDADEWLPAAMVAGLEEGRAFTTEERDWYYAHICDRIDALKGGDAAAVTAGASRGPGPGAGAGPGIETVFFDCDDCLYQNDWQTAGLLTKRIEGYCVEKLGLAPGRAYDLYKKHGTCLKGLVVENVIADTEEAMDACLEAFHDVPLTGIERDPALRAMILGIRPEVRRVGRTCRSGRGGGVCVWVWVCVCCVRVCVCVCVCVCVVRVCLPRTHLLRLTLTHYANPHSFRPTKVKKWVFTASVASHAQRCLEALGIADLFLGIIDVKAVGNITKHSPGAFRRAMEIAGVLRCGVAWFSVVRLSLRLSLYCRCVVAALSLCCRCVVAVCCCESLWFAMFRCVVPVLLPRVVAMLL